MKKYKAFCVKFFTKGYFLKNDKGHKIKGRAYYVIDDNYNIIKQFAQIDEATFRPTDIEMQKTIGYYLKKSNIVKLRQKYLEPYQILKNLHPNQISKKDNNRLEIPIDIINELNLELIKLDRIKTSISLFIGSNPSGAETNHTAINIICFDNEDENVLENGTNFSNPFNRKEIFKTNKNILINSLDDLYLIEIKDFFKKNKKAKELFKIYNYSKYFIFYDIHEEEKINFDQIYSNLFDEDQILKKYSTLNNKNKIEFFTNSIKDTIKIKVNEIIKEYCETKIEYRKKKEIEKKLRKYQKILVEQEIRDLLKSNPNLESKYFNNFIENNFSPNSIYCHIIPVRESLKDDRTLFEIADNNNCLLLDPNLHYSFDRYQIVFDSNGNCFNRKNKMEKYKLKKEILNKNRKKYLEEYEEKYWPHKLVY